MDSDDYFMAFVGAVIVFLILLLIVALAFPTDAADTARCCCQCVCQ